MPSKWTPREYMEKGRKVFCSEACGGGYATCSVKSYKKALAQCKDAVRQMGPGWKAVPFENLGWHSVIVNKKIGARIHIQEAKGRPVVFTCELSYEGRQVWGNPSKSPAQALNSARNWLETQRLLYVRWLEKIAPGGNSK